MQDFDRHAENATAEIGDGHLDSQSGTAARGVGVGTVLVGEDTDPDGSGVLLRPGVSTGRGS